MHPRRTPSMRRLAVAVAVCLGFAACVGVATRSARASEDARPLPGPFHDIHVIDFKGDIEAVMYAYVKRSVEAAIEDGADCIVLRFDSPGGTVFHSKKIADVMLGVPKNIHTIAWVPVEAFSGASMVSLACREVVMKPGTSLGDCQPIVFGSGGIPKPVGEKLESPLRTWFREFAEQNGYPEALVEAFVSAHIDVLKVRKKGTQETWFVRGSDFRDAQDDAELVPGVPKRELEQVGAPVVREGELLTLTAAEALDLGFIRRRFDGGLPKDEAALLAVIKAPGARVTFTKMSFSEKAGKWLLGIAGILAALVALSIILFVWQGPGLMTIVGGSALLILVFITLTADQLNGFPVFLILVGMALLAVEVFVIPGFGLAGILGIASLCFGLFLLVTGRGFDELGTLGTGTVVDFALQFLLTVLACFLAFLALSRFFPRIGPGRRMILVPSGAPAGVQADAPAVSPVAVGDVGRARSTLRPAGTVEFDGRLVDVTSEGDYLEPGTRVRVVRIEGPRVTVTREEEAS